MQLLTRFWFEFDLSGEALRRFGYFPAYGVGITAYNYHDAMSLLRKWVVRGDKMPKITKVIENVDVSRLLEANFAHTKLLPHLGCPAWRGVWHPAFNLWYGPDLQYRNESVTVDPLGVRTEESEGQTIHEKDP